MYSGILGTPAIPEKWSALSTVGIKPGVKQVVFSVGNIAGDDEYVTKNSNGDVTTATISNGIITFSFPQTHPYIGIGDEINDLGIYLTKKITVSKWLVADSVGNKPADQLTPFEITKIDKVFAGIIDALDGYQSGNIKCGAMSLIDPSPGTTLDIVSLGITVKIVCYDKDAIDEFGSETCDIMGWITDEYHYVNLYTPIDIRNECNSKQRHVGFWGGSGYELRVDSSSNEPFEISCDYTVIEGFKIDGGTTPSTDGAKVIGDTFRTSILNNIIKGCVDGIDNTDPTTPGFQKDTVIRGNMIYDCSGSGINDHDETGYMINNTIVGCPNGISNDGTTAGSAGIVVNCLIQCTATGSNVHATKWYNSITSATGIQASGVNCRDSLDIQFRDEAGKDYHLDIFSSDAIDSGGNPTLVITSFDISFDKDYDGDRIPSGLYQWYVGADFFTPTQYFAIGETADLKIGTSTFSVTNGVMTFNESQTHELLTVGCKVTGGAGEWFLYKRITDKIWWVTDGSGNPGANIGSTTIGTIEFPYANLKDAIYDDGSSEPGIVTDGYVSSIDLTYENLKIVIACVEGENTESVIVAWYCDSARNIKLYAPGTPGDGGDCNTSRRHSGEFDDNIYVLNASDTDSLSIDSDYINIDGLQVKSDYNGITLSYGKSPIITNNIIAEASLNALNIIKTNPSEDSVIANNLIYGHGESGIYIREIDPLLAESSNYYIYNNTLYGGKHGMHLEVSTESENTNIIHLVNNLVQNTSVSDYYAPNGGFEFIESITNYSQDSSLLKFFGYSDTILITILFRDAVNKNFRLTLYDSSRMLNTTDLSADGIYAFDVDNEGDTRSTIKWDAGSDNWTPDTNGAHYSIGINDEDLNQNPGTTVSIENSILTFSDDVGELIGIGDKVTHGSGTCFLAEKGTRLKWYVVDSVGDSIPATVVDSAITNIKRVANSLNDLNDPSIKIYGELGNTRNIVTATTNGLNLWCYDDGEDPGGVLIENWTTDSDHRMIIRVPWDINTQCNANQRHDGTWNDGGFAIVSSDPNCLTIDNEYTRFSGARIEPASNVSVSDHGVKIKSGSNYSQVDSNVIRNAYNAIIQETTANGSGIVGNIAYDSAADGIVADKGWCYSNTVVGSGGNGIVDTADTDTRNCISVGSTNDDFSGGATRYNCISEDTSAGSSNGCIQEVVIEFADAINNNYKLKRSDWPALNRGQDLTDIATEYKMLYDIDSNKIDGLWSIGADITPGFETIDLYFSAGKNTDDLLIGLSIVVKISNGIAEFSEKQTNENLGIGDKLTYDGSKVCYLKRKIDEYRWEVVTAFGLAPENESVKVEANSIRHTFVEISDSVLTSGFQDILKSGNNLFTNLDLAQYRIHIPVYKNSIPHYDTVHIIGLTQSEDHYLRIYVPNDEINECVKNQAHPGYYIGGANEDVDLMAEESKSAFIVIEVAFTRVEGLIIDNDDYAIVNSGIIVLNVIGCRIDGNIVLNSKNGIDIQGSNRDANVINNIVYAVYQHGISCSGNDSVCNNTVIDSDLSNAGYHGINNSPTDILINNIVQDSVVGSDYNTEDGVYYSVSSDPSLSSGLNGNVYDHYVSFVNAPNKDYHISSNEMTIRGRGKNLSYEFEDDATHINRGRLWDMGALEHIPIKNVCFAVGKYAGDISIKVNGLLYFNVDDNSVIEFKKGGSEGSPLPQTNDKFGIGNEVIASEEDNDFPDRCFLVEKLSEYRYKVSDKFGNPIVDKGGQVSSIKRPFNTILNALNETRGIFGPDFLNTTNLLVDTTRVTLAMYCDDKEIPELIEELPVINLNCDADYYFRMVVPADELKEINLTQRHDGNTWSGGGTLVADGDTNIRFLFKFLNTDFFEFEGFILTKNYRDFTPTDGIITEGCNDFLISSNIIHGFQQKTLRNAIDVTLGNRGNGVILNNLIYQCKNDAIVCRSVYNSSPETITHIYNNTIVYCGRGVYFNKGSMPTGNKLKVKNNIVQGSIFKDYVSDYPNQGSFFELSNNISQDETSQVFGGQNNQIYKTVNFVNDNIYSDTDFDLDSDLEKNAVNAGEDLTENEIFPFYIDIKERERVAGEWDIGAFELALIINSDTDLSFGPVVMSTGATTISSVPPTLILHLRKDESNFIDSVDSRFQFTNIPDLNTFLDENTYYDIFNLLIYVQGGISFPGAFELRNRGIRTAKIATYPEEMIRGPGVIIYTGPLVDEISAQSLLTLEYLKIYSDDYAGALAPFLINDDSATSDIKIINSLVQVNKNALLGYDEPGVVTVQNSTLVFSNEDDEADIYLTLSDTQGCRIVNSSILTKGSLAKTFSTIVNPGSEDVISNCYAHDYEYGGMGFEFGADNLGYVDPKYTEGEVLGDVVSAYMVYDFKPRVDSPLIDAGNNSFVDGTDESYDEISVDIIGGERIFNNGTVDIGHYEIPVYKLIFGLEDIRDLFQDKLIFNPLTRQFIPTYDDVVYNDLYYQFINNPWYRQEFVRESKIIIRLKESLGEYKLYSDKVDEEIVSLEAYYDSISRSIVISKGEQSFGEMFNHVFKEGKYVFYFDQLKNTIKIFLKDTHDKGLSGIKNPVKNIKFGGISVVNK